MSSNHYNETSWTIKIRTYVSGKRIRFFSCSLACSVPCCDLSKTGQRQSTFKKSKYLGKFRNRCNNGMSASTTTFASSSSPCVFLSTFSTTNESFHCAENRLILLTVNLYLRPPFRFSTCRMNVSGAVSGGSL